MRFSINGAELYKGLAAVNRFVPKRAARPVLQNVCISANGAIELLGTDLETGIRYVVPGTVDVPGDCLVSSARFTAIVKSLAGGDITYANGGEDFTAEIRGPSRYFKLVGEDPADFPAVPPFPEKGGISVPFDALADVYGRAARCAASEETRYAIHGVQLVLQRKSIRLIGTDGKRLALAESKGLALEMKGEMSALMPGAAIGRILSLRPKRKSARANWPENVDIAIEERRVFLRYGPATVVTTIIDGTFPAYEEVIPKQTEYTAVMDAAALGDCLSDAALLASEGSMAVSMKFQGSTLTVGAKASNVGEVQAEMGILYGGPPTEIHFNPRYFLDFLAGWEGATVNLHFNEARSAVRLETDPDLGCYVLMPVTLESVD